jgi:hypothetical protein
MTIKLEKEIYSLSESLEIISGHFKGWSSKYKLSAIFQYHPKYEVIKQGSGQRTRFFIRREKLRELIRDIERGQIM